MRSSPQQLVTNFESEQPSSYYAELYKRDNLQGGHVIMLGADADSRQGMRFLLHVWMPGPVLTSHAFTPRQSIFASSMRFLSSMQWCASRREHDMQFDRSAALEALRAYPGGLQLGGGVTANNAAAYLDAGASHVIVTSYVFRDGRLDEDRLRELVRCPPTRLTLHAAPVSPLSTGDHFERPGRAMWVARSFSFGCEFHCGLDLDPDPSPDCRAASQRREPRPDHVP